MGVECKSRNRMVALLPVLWIFGVCAILYGSTLLYWAWHSPEDADAAKVYIAGGMAMVSGVIWLMCEM